MAFLFGLVFIPIKINAVNYIDTNRDNINYDFNTFSVVDNYVVISGWGVGSHTQEYTGPESHEYSLVVINKNTNQSKIYNGEIKPVDKTELMRYKTTYRVCGTYEFYATLEACYYRLPQVGFEFKIPLSDLNVDNEYDLKFRIYEKYTNVGYQTSVYALGVDDYYDVNGARYQLYSNLQTTNLVGMAPTLMIRTGPSTTYSQMRGDHSCSPYSTRLYWTVGEKYTNIYEVVKTNGNNIDSETWLRMGFNEGYCYDGRSRALNGTAKSGWAALVFFDTVGTPATIKVSSLQYSTIDEMKTYTAEANTTTKAIVKLTNNKNQTVNIKAYHNNQLVHDSNQTFNGTKEFTIQYKIPNSGTLKIVVTEPYNYTHIMESKIYISSNQTYNIGPNDDNKILTIDTPILVVKNKNGNVTEYKEKIELSATPKSYIITQGRGLETFDASLSYYYPTNEFNLNTDFNAYALFPSQEENLNYEVINNKVKVNLNSSNIQKSNNYETTDLTLPKMYISESGDIYSSKNNLTNYIDGGNVWYPNWNDELGVYDYSVVGTRIGINKVTIIRNLQYKITNTFITIDKGIFKIKRVKNPNNLNYVFKKTFTYEELLNYLEVNK